MQALLTSLVEGVAPPMRLAKFEGDAVFCQAPTEAVARAQTVLDGVDDVYCRFSATRERIVRNTTCPCRACRRAGDLDLKFVLHHGEYAEHSIAGRTELAGTAVIAVHRLMKNRIRESTGIDAYLFVTEAAAQALDETTSQADKMRHDETVDGIGVVSGWVTDMRPIWQHRKEKERAWIAPDAALWFDRLRTTLPISPATAWTYLLDINQRLRWVEGMTGMSVDGRPDGRMDEGATMHCAHGKDTLDFEIVDWRPFETFSQDLRLPLGVVVRTTFALAWEPNGNTEVEVRLRPVRYGKGPFARSAGRLLLGLAKRKVQPSMARSVAALTKIVGDDIAAGRIERWQPAKDAMTAAGVPAF
jgi:hypothetical protein